jgi:hypothetical protein
MRPAPVRLALAACLVAATALPAWAQTEPPKPLPQVERVGPDRVRIGEVEVDLARKELRVTGTVTDAITLEFVATVKGGNKSYESALELDTNVISFNLALILVGLDPDRGNAAQLMAGRGTPVGDPVEVWVELSGGGRRIRAEELVYNTGTKRTLSEGPWAYTGSVESPMRDGRLFAEVDGTLIGFIHSPSPLIESPRPFTPGTYGDNRLNPALNLKPGTVVTLTVRALPRTPAAGSSK